MRWVTPSTVRTSTVSPWIATRAGVLANPLAPGMGKRRTSLSDGTSSTASSGESVGLPASPTTRRWPDPSKAIAWASGSPLA